MNRTAIALTVSALLLSATACGASNDVSPTPVESVATSAPDLTDKQIHIVEDAEKVLASGGYSEEGLKQYIIDDEGYSVEDVTAAVNSIACDLDWNREATEKAETYGIEDKAEIKKRLLADGFTEEQAEYGANPVPQN